MNRARTAAIVVFVVVVLALWVRNQRAREERNRRLADALATATAKEARRIEAIRVAAAQPMPDAPRACPQKTRVRVVRLTRIDARGGSLHDVIAAIEEQRDPEPWSHELDVVEGRAFLYDYGEERVVCIGTEADDPHGTLVAHDVDSTR